MRAVVTLALILIAHAAEAQTSNQAQNSTSPFQNMQASDATRLNQAAQTDTRARDALDQAEKALKAANHPTGTLLEKTRP